MTGAVRRAWRDSVAVLEAHSTLPRGELVFGLPAGLALGVLVYVLVHEALHALACIAVGGSVARIEIAPIFGGHLLAGLFPVVTPATDYAGRLASFDVGGSSLRLLVIDLAPYLLTVFLGVPVVRRLARRPRAWLLAPALLVALAPWLSLTGDYYEVGSTLVTAGLTEMGVDWSALRSDDLVRLCSALWAEPRRWGISTPASAAGATGVVLASTVVGFLSASLTYALGEVVAEGCANARGSRTAAGS